MFMRAHPRRSRRSWLPVRRRQALLSFLRVFVFAFPLVVAAGSTNVAGQLHSAWVGALVVLAIATMTVGNVVAIAQNNVKRMLAYSSIAHAGYALVGFVAAGAAVDIEKRNAAITAVIFYLLTYAVMNLGAFAVVQLIARAGDRRTEVEDYNGIGFQSPWLAFSLSLFLLSLLGMPLTAGFIGKVMVFRAALDEGYYVLVVIGVLNTAISAYYYLRLIIVMFFRERTTSWNAPRIPVSVGRGARHHHPWRSLPGPVSWPRDQRTTNQTGCYCLTEVKFDCSS